MAQTRMNGMMMEGPALPVTPGKVEDVTYWQTATNVASVAADFAGLNTANAHLCDSTPDSDTSSLMVAAKANSKIVVSEVSVTQTGGTTGYVGTLCQAGETADIIQFACGQYGQARFNSMFELEENKGLVLCRAQGEDDGATNDANCVTVWYTYVPA